LFVDLLGFFNNPLADGKSLAKAHQASIPVSCVSFNFVAEPNVAAVATAARLAVSSAL